MDNQGVEGRQRNNEPHAIESSAAGRMLRAVNLAAVDAENSADELDAAAKALVTELRRANEPPEQVLVQIKRILAEAGLRPSAGPADPSLIIEQHVVLYRTVIESSIRHYFAPGDGPEPASA
jgi:hypothetical protein